MSDILNSVSKKDAKWREIAFNITKNKSDADDLVQEMYLRLHKYKVQKWNYSFIILMLWNLFKDSKKKKTIRVDLKDSDEFVTITENNSYNDRELYVLSLIDKLPEQEKKLLDLNYDLSLTQIAKNLDLCRTQLYRDMEQIRLKILRHNFSKEYKNRRLKNSNKR